MHFHVDKGDFPTPLGSCIKFYTCLYAHMNQSNSLEIVNSPSQVGIFCLDRCHGYPLEMASCTRYTPYILCIIGFSKDKLCVCIAWGCCVDSEFHSDWRFVRVFYCTRIPLFQSVMAFFLHYYDYVVYSQSKGMQGSRKGLLG